MSRPLLCVCLVLSERVCNDLFCKDPHVAKQVWHSKPACGKAAALRVSLSGKEEAVYV